MVGSKYINLVISIIERAEHSDTTLDPVRLRLIGRHSEHEHEVGRVTSCHQGSTTLTSLVHGAVIVLVILDFGLDAGFEPNHGCFDE
jgi:hypothetical protein